MIMDQISTSMIADALVATNMTADKLFKRVEEELARGNREGARAQLNFVDYLVAARKEEK